MNKSEGGSKDILFAGELTETFRHIQRVKLKRRGLMVPYGYSKYLNL